MPAALTLARLAIWEAARRRLLLALAALTIAVIAASGWGFTRLWTIRRDGQPITALEVHLLTSQFLILLAFMFAATLALSAAFVAAPSLSGDVESGLVLSLLARPLRRLELALGRWLGMACLVLVYAAGTTALELLAAWWATGYAPPHPFQLAAYMAAEGLVLLSLALLLSTRLAGMTGGIVALLLYFVAWVGGIVAGAGQALDNPPLSAAGVFTRLLLPTDGLWRGAVYALEPSSVLALAPDAGPVAAANPFLVAGPPSPAFLVWVVVWVLGVLALTVWSFSRREI